MPPREQIFTNEHRSQITIDSLIEQALYIFKLSEVHSSLKSVWWSRKEGDMEGSEYRNIANKIEQTPHHRKKYNQLTDTARFTWSKFFFSKKNVITVTSTFQTKETHHKTFLPQSPHVKFLAVAFISLGDTKMSQRSYCCQVIRQCFRYVSLQSSEVRIHSHKRWSSPFASFDLTTFFVWFFVLNPFSIS